MLVLKATTEQIQVVLAGAITTSQLDCFACFRDIAAATYAAGSNATATNGVTDVNLVPAPAPLTQRVIDYLSVYNNDTAPATVTIKQDNGGVERILWRGALGASEGLTYTDGTGWSKLNTGGVPVAGGSGGNPTALVGTVAINGVASTFLRSDGAPALDQAIAPVWKAAHTFTKSGGGGNGAAIQLRAAQPALLFVDTTAGIDGQKWQLDANVGAFRGFTVNAADGAIRDWIKVIRIPDEITISQIMYGNPTDNPPHLFYGAQQFYQGGSLIGALGRSATINAGGSATMLGLRHENDGLEIAGHGGVIHTRAGPTGTWTLNGGLQSAAWIEVNKPGASDGYFGVNLTGVDSFWFGSNNSGATNGIGAPNGTDYIFTNQGRPIVFGTAATVRMTVNGGGGVTIAAPGGGVGLRLMRTATDVLDFYHGGGVQHIDASQPGAALALDTGGIVRMTVNAFGAVALTGSTNASFPTLNVIQSAAGVVMQIGTNVSASAILRFVWDSSPRGDIGPSQGVMVGGIQQDLGISAYAGGGLDFGTNNGLRRAYISSAGVFTYYADGNTGGPQEIGFRHLPPAATFSASTAANQTNGGKGLAYDGPGGHSITLPDLEVGTIITIINAGTGVFFLAATSSLYWFNGSAFINGSRNLAVGGVATLWHRGGGSWWVWGVGLS